MVDKNNNFRSVHQGFKTNTKTSIYDRFRKYRKVKESGPYTKFGRLNLLDEKTKVYPKELVKCWLVHDYIWMEKYLDTKHY